MPEPDRERVSLIIFTYNDAVLVDALLAGVGEWHVRPDEIIVVDDGSVPPYVPPPQASPFAPFVRLIRFDANQGITHAKHAGVEAASFEAVLALDCDTRLSPEWLTVCLERLSEPGVGMVSGPVVHDSGDDLVSRYLRAFGDNHNLDADGEVDFIPGNAWLIRAEAWRQVGGMAGHTREVCEDHYLCHALRGAGWKLVCDRRAVARQTRRISRPALARRVWTWCHLAIKTHMPPPEGLPAYVFATLTKPMAERMGLSVDMGEPLFLYLELLYWSYCLSDLLAHGEARLHYPPVLRRAMWDGLRQLLAGRPRLYGLLRADMALAGQPALPGTPGALRAAMPGALPEPGEAGGRSQAGNTTGATAGIFADSFDIFDALTASGVWEWLDGPGVEAMLAEDATVDRHFSFYAQSGPMVG